MWCPPSPTNNIIVTLLTLCLGARPGLKVGRKFCVDKIQNGGADSCIIYQTPGRFALLIITSLKEFFVRMFCRSSESSTNSGWSVNCNQFYFLDKNNGNGILVNTFIEGKESWAGLGAEIQAEDYIKFMDIDDSYRVT